MLPADDDIARQLAANTSDRATIPVPTDVVTGKAFDADTLATARLCARSALRDADGFKGRCGICEYRYVCGGSRARAYAVSGDPLGPERLPAVARRQMAEPEDLVEAIIDALARGRRDLTYPRWIASGYVAQALAPSFFRRQLKKHTVPDDDSGRG